MVSGQKDSTGNPVASLPVSGDGRIGQTTSSSRSLKRQKVPQLSGEGSQVPPEQISPIWHRIQLEIILSILMKRG